MPTKIEWCEEVWSPVTGCTPVSEGCQNCYARRMANRLRGRCGYPADDPFKVMLHMYRLDQPSRWRKPRMILVCSMGDLFHEDVSDWFIEDVFAQMEIMYRRHTFLILTKRPKRIVEFFDHPSGRNLPSNNIWFGVSFENQATADERIPVLLGIPAAVRFVSYEPALGPVDLRLWLPSLDWVIMGCESGPKARPMEIEWARSMRDQCITSKIPFFLKQMMVGDKLVHMPELDGKRWEQRPGVK